MTYGHVNHSPLEFQIRGTWIERMLFDKIQIFFTLFGLALLAAAGYLGFGNGNWIPCIALGGAGSGAFIYGVQHEPKD